MSDLPAWAMEKALSIFTTNNQWNPAQQERIARALVEAYDHGFAEGTDNALKSNT